jgi:acetamidase/formamidase
MADRHVLKVSPRTVQWGVWDASLEPVLRVKSGDLVEIHTISGEPEDLPPGNEGVAPEHLEVHAKRRRGPGPHFLTGPVWVDGAEPGDALEVRIREVRLRDDWGWNLILPLRGTLPEDFPEPRRMHLPIDRRAMTARLPWGKEVPLKPFFGNFGVAPPARYGAIDSLVPREHGGNMDNKELVAGTTVYFPVWNQGALFSAGDGHAAQGDGEVCLTAIETGLVGTFELVVRKDLRIGFPRAVSATHYISMGMNEDLDDAARQALRHMIDWITELTPLTRADAYSLCSIAADLRVTQMVDGNKGIHCMLPKAMLEM